MTETGFRRSVAVLCALGAVPTIVVVAANGRSLPLFPGYAYGPPRGDTYGFYAAAREFISSWTHVPKPLLAVATLALIGLLAFGYYLWRRAMYGTAVGVIAVAIALYVSLAVHEMGPTGAGAVGWPIVWSLPLFPLRAAHALSYHAAFAVGIAIVIICNIVTVVATALIARRLVPGRLALIAPALVVIWPFGLRLVEGTGGVVYESWLDYFGNILYAEPLSTALVMTALALVLLRPTGTGAAALAGALVSFAAAVRVSDATIALVLFLALAVGRRRHELIAYTLTGVGVAAIAGTFWSKGYSSFTNKPSNQAPDGLFSWHYVARSWRDSQVFDWKMALLLVPLGLLGAWCLRGRAVDLIALGGTVAITAVFYSAYYVTALHPRFLFAALPPLFVLIAAGVANISRTLEREPAPRAP